MPDLAALIAKQGSDLKLRQALVTSAPTGGTCTIRFGDLASTTVADDIAGVRILAGVGLNNGDTVQVLQTGGALLIVGRVAGAADAWIAYTPALTASTTNPTLGSGSVQIGRFGKVGRTVSGIATIVFGSSGVAAGSGEYRIGLPPFAASDPGVNIIIGSGYIFDSSALQLVPVTFAAAAGQAGYGVMFRAGTGIPGFQVTDAAPWVWAVGDSLQVFFDYEAAS